MKVGLITMHNVCNFGAVLQTYAMTQILEDMEHDCTIIDYVPDVRKGLRVFFPVERGVNVIKKVMSWIKWLPVKIGWQKQFKKFMLEKYKLTPQKYIGNGSMYIDTPIFDAYITGSDQVWNPGSTDGLNEDYFLSFVPKDKKKISYAASISSRDLSSKNIKDISNYLKDYISISVREQQGVDLLEDIGINKVEHVLDPTLLLNPYEWSNLANESIIKQNDKYLLMYVLGFVPELIEHAHKIAKQRNLKVLKIGWDFKKPKGVDRIIAFANPQDFVKLFLNADYVITNSFHGTAFSINFNKDFMSLPSAPNNPRFMSLLDMFDLQDRCLKDEFKLENFVGSVDYSKVNDILQKERKKSIDFLKKSLKD